MSLAHAIRPLGILLALAASGAGCSTADGSAEPDDGHVPTMAPPFANEACASVATSPVCRGTHCPVRFDAPVACGGHPTRTTSFASAGSQAGLLLGSDTSVPTLFTFDGATVAARSATIDERAFGPEPELFMDGHASPHVFFREAAETGYTALLRHQEGLLAGGLAETVATIDEDVQLAHAVGADGTKYSARASGTTGVTLATSAPGIPSVWKTVTLAPTAADRVIVAFDSSGRLHIVARLLEPSGLTSVDIVDGHVKPLAVDGRGPLTRVVFPTDDGDPVGAVRLDGGDGTISVSVSGRSVKDIRLIDRLGVHAEQPGDALPICGGCASATCREYAVKSFPTVDLVIVRGRTFFVYGYTHLDRDIEQAYASVDRGHGPESMCTTSRVVADRSRFHLVIDELVPGGTVDERWDGVLQPSVQSVEVGVRGDAIALVAVQELGFRYLEVDIDRLH